jgi:hypothetical protein
VPAAIRADFARVSLTAGTCWGSVALFLSVVPPDAGALLHTGNLAVLGAIGALALGASCVTQIAARPIRWGLRRSQATGLAVIAAGLIALVIAAPLRSLTLLFCGAAAAGAGHGLSFLNAQDELNSIAPADRRGEVTAAFICVIYLMVGGAVIAAGLISVWLPLQVAVAAVASLLAVTAVITGAWQAPALVRRDPH